MEITIKTLKELESLSENNEIKFEFKGSCYFIDCSIIWVNSLCTIIIHNLVDEDIQKQVWKAFLKDLKTGVKVTIK